jgi:hypothetical protein
MLNIYTPLRWFRLTIQRASRLNGEKPDTLPIGAESEKLNNDDPPRQSASEAENADPQKKAQPSRLVIFFHGVCRAMFIGLFVTLVLAMVPGFEPDIGPFQTRLLDFIQWYGIPISSGILVWYGIRATL